MAQFNTLVGSILQDIIRAQHEANLYSLSLRDQYSTSNTGSIPVPGAMLDGLELELKYAFQKTDVRRNEQQTDFAALKRYLSDLATQLARIALSSVTSTIGKAEEADPQALNLLVEQEQKLWEGFGAFLARKIKESLTPKAAELTTADGTLDKELIQRDVMRVVEIHLLDNAELSSLFESNELRQRVRANLSDTLAMLVGKRTKDYNFMRTNTFHSPEIIVTADELKKLPIGAIHTMRVSVSPQSYRPDQPIDIKSTQ